MSADHDFDEVELPMGGTVAGAAMPPGGRAKLDDLIAQSDESGLEHAFRSGLAVGIPRGPGAKTKTGNKGGEASPKDAEAD